MRLFLFGCLMSLAPVIAMANEAAPRFCSIRVLVSSRFPPREDQSVVGQ